MNALMVRREIRSAADHKRKDGEPHSYQPLTSSSSSYRSTTVAAVVGTQDVSGWHPCLRP
jgi:hypothetical protein